MFGRQSAAITHSVMVFQSAVQSALVFSYVAPVNERLPNLRGKGGMSEISFRNVLTEREVGIFWGAWAGTRDPPAEARRV
jgi:hypothetical protein